MFKIHKLIISLVFSIYCCVLFAQSDNNQETDTVHTDAILTGGEYKLSPGDIVSVTVFGEPDISETSVRVPLSGIYDYPLIGKLKLIGETTTSLSNVVESKLRQGFLSDPKVSVNIVQYRPVIVTGAVENAGRIDYQEGMTVRILSALARVDNNSLDLDKIEIQRNSIITNPVNLDTAILPGDIVSYKITSKAGYYYIYGEVNRSGKYEFEDGLTVEQAIIVAGGYSPFASKRNVTIRRTAAEDVIKVKLHEPVEAGDVITIKKRWF